MKCISIVSGGLDSVTMAYRLAADGWDQRLLSFDYGQRHVKELESAQRCADALNVAHTIVDLHSVTPLLWGSSLTDMAVDVPDGHYAAPSMAATVVPNRNAIMLSIAYAAAIADGAEAVAMGVHTGDHFVYPDCRPDFIEQFAAMELVAAEGHIAPEFELLTPWIDVDKTEIARQAHMLGVPIADTWSCYKGRDIHCGTCGTCVERKEALRLAGVVDPTEYLA
jgi:7-cyano-7-deazaguanine synthase